MHDSFYSKPSIHRTYQIVRWPHVDQATKLQPYLQNCSSLERLSVVQHLPNEYANLENPTALEYLVAEQSGPTTLLQLPPDLREFINVNHCLPSQAHIEKYPHEIQLLTYQYASWTTQIVNKTTTSVDEILKYLDALPATIKSDPLFQQIFAAKESGLFLNFIERHRDEYIDSLACGLALTSGHTFKSSIYKYLDVDTFKDLFTYSSKQSITICLKPPQLGFPKEFISALNEVNPALYLQSVILNDDTRNAEAHVTKWFQPMLVKTLQWTQTNPAYLNVLLTALPTPNGRKHFNKLMERYAPNELALLRMCESLYNTRPDKTYSESYTQWAKAVSNAQTESAYVDLPGLELN